MKTKRFYQGITLLAIALTTAACQNELNEESSEPKPGEKINMTIRATQGTGAQTRTSYEDKLGGGTAGNIVVKWEGGTAQDAPVEKINVFAYYTGADFTTPAEFTSDPKSLSSNGLSITFEGTVTPTEGYWAIYPASNCKLVYGSLEFDFSNQEQDCTAGQEMAHLKKCDIMAGQPVADGANNFEFEHQATMLRFDLTLPTAESINEITLTSANNNLSTAMRAILAGHDINYEGFNDVKNISLSITNHTSSTSLKAYMMTYPCDLSNDELTVTVNTVSGSIYKGKLTTGADTKLKAGKCYTLKPTLISNTITILSVTAGSLKNELDKITSPNPEQTKLVLTGTVNDNDITALKSFLKAAGTNITTVDLSGLTNTSIGDMAFEDCSNLTEIVLPEGITSIGSNAFSGCSNLANIVLPAGITSIKTSTFDGCSNLTEIVLPKGITSIENLAFKGCSSLTKIVLPASITNVGHRAFKGCTGLTAIVFEGNKTVGTGNGEITLGTDILDNTNADLKIFLPKITDNSQASGYKALGNKVIYYDFKNNYDSATPTQKVDSTLYNSKIDVDTNSSSDLEDLGKGDEWGSK